MDINALGAQYLNSPYVPFSSSSAQAAQGLQSEGNGAFEELLKKAQDKNFVSANSQGSIASGIKKTPIDKSDKLYEVCMELETFLIKNLIKSMRGTVQKTKLIDPGFAGEVYEDMLYDEYAKSFAQNANLGFAEMAYRELSGYR